MQSTETSFDGVSQMLRATILHPPVRPGPLKASFGRNQKIGRIWMQRLGDETLGNDGPIGVGSVDEIDSQLDCATQDCNRLVMIGRFSPTAVAGDLHCTAPASAK